jgi:3-dehydroquinate synthase
MKVIDTKNYSIYLGDSALSELKVDSYSQVAILVDENTKKDCLPILIENNISLKNALVIAIPSGEKNKNIIQCQLIWEELSKANFDRNSLLINLGGGLVGDIGGFAASCYKRGIQFIQIPTSLLAMVDASIGGKLGFDFNNLKNQIGLFNNPATVLIYPEFLKTLDQRQIKSGYAEVLKHALIADKNYWDKLLKISIVDTDWEDIILRSIEIKKKIVEEDPEENNIRKILNFGHTIGHAIESYYLEEGQDILHGEAIALGMILESKMSEISESEKQLIENYITKNLNIPKTPSLTVLEKWIIQDKKNNDGKIQFSLLENLGSCSYNQTKQIKDINEYF